MAIKHNVYENGRTQSLSVDIRGTRLTVLDRFPQEMVKSARLDATVGVMEEGDHDFGIAQQRETIIVLSGEITTEDGCEISPQDLPIVYEKGKQIKFRCFRQVAYMCIYG